MAQIHDTTMSPTKLEVLQTWLPEQEWYAGNGEPDLSRVGGFRLDDPDGEVGIEFMFVHDATGDGTTYHVPMTYRGAPLAGADNALIGNGEHGVLGTRWIYDGAHDPVLLTQLAALLQGRAQPQHQSQSDTADPTVHVEDALARDAEIATDRIRVVRLLRVGEAGRGTTRITATWRTTDDREERGSVVVLD